MTGGSAGIGFGIIAHLVQHNASKIYLLSQKEEHADEAISKVKDFGDHTVVEWVQCNLKSLHQTLSVANKLKSLPKIDALILNAGEGVGVYNLSSDGIDTHFQVNHLSQMLLALMLLPILQRTPESRLVVQSSDMHRFAPGDIQFANLQEINRDIGPSYLYNRSKLAQILFVRHLSKLFYNTPSASSTSSSSAPSSDAAALPKYPYINATHPGGIRTDQQAQAEEAYGVLGKIGVVLASPLLKDPVDSGCRSALWAATSKEVVEGNVRGAYVVPDKKVTEPSGQARDEGLAERLWRLSEGLLREKLGGLPYEEVGGGK